MPSHSLYLTGGKVSKKWIIPHFCKEIILTTLKKKYKREDIGWVTSSAKLNISQMILIHPISLVSLNIGQNYEN